MKKMSIIKRVKDYCIEYTRYIFDSDNCVKKSGIYDKKLITSLARAKRQIIDIIRMNLTEYSCLLTLTYRDNMQDYERAYKDFNIFVKLIKYNYNMSLRYLRVIELQKRGAIHFHVIIFNRGFMDIAYTDIFNLWGHGAVYIQKIENVDITTADKVGNYLGKYLTKSKDIDINKKIYTTSRNLKRVEKERKIIEDEIMFNYYDKLYEKNTDVVINVDDYRCKKYIKGI